MKPYRCWAATLLLALSALGASPPENREQALVWMAEIRGTINPASSDYLKSTLQKASRAGATALIVELDTPGGLLSSVREMTETIAESPIPIIVYTTPAGASATSAGALLMLASHLAAMAPGTRIGAAHPVGNQGEDIGGEMGKKILSDTTAFARSLAELRGRPSDPAERVVAKSVSFTADEALDEHLVELLASDPSELLDQLDGRKVVLQGGREATLHTRGAAVHREAMTFGQSLLELLANPNIAAVLMSLGMLLIYVELSHPGAVLPGILGGICLLVAFMALQLLPIRAGAVALLALALGLFAAEPFVTAHGALAAGGVMSFALGTLWLTDPAATGLRIDLVLWGAMVVTLSALVAIVAVSASRVHKLSRRARALIGGGALDGLSGYEGSVETASSDGLRGTILIRGELWKFRSDEKLNPGDPVEVVRTDGMVVQVMKRRNRP